MEALIIPQDPGRRLREVRERLGLKYRDVQEATQVIARLRGNQEFAVGLSRLADIENRGTVPSIYRLYSLCATYGLTWTTVLGWYGVNLGRLAADTARTSHSRTRVAEMDRVEPASHLPAAHANGAAPNKTAYLGRNGLDPTTIPVALAKLQPERRYALIGTDDWSMYPLIHPGAFAQVDEKTRHPEAGPWANEHERPIYLVETHDGYSCAWCTARGKRLTLEFHPSSGLAPIDLATPQQGEIVGKVVGLAMRLDSAKRRRTRS